MVYCGGTPEIYDPLFLFLSPEIVNGSIHVLSKVLYKVFVAHSHTNTLKAVSDYAGCWPHHWGQWTGVQGHAQTKPSPRSVDSTCCATAAHPTSILCFIFHHPPSLHHSCVITPSPGNWKLLPDTEPSPPASSIASYWLLCLLLMSHVWSHWLTGLICVQAEGEAHFRHSVTTLKSIQRHKT